MFALLYTNITTFITHVEFYNVTFYKKSFVHFNRCFLDFKPPGLKRSPVGLDTARGPAVAGPAYSAFFGSEHFIFHE